MSFSGSLPQQSDGFIGRERELAEVRRLLGRHRLLTLVGPGGTGKTRLAVKVASELCHEFKDGVCFVALAPITDQNHVLTAIAGALNVRESGDEAIMTRLKRYLSDKSLLLVLDNFEQVIAAAPIVTEVVGASSHLKVLVTSREVLHLYGEQEFPVPPLNLPDHEHLPPLDNLAQYDAVQLFITRALMVKPGFAVNTESAPAIVEICHRLDGLPLAIELAAARIKLLPPRALLARLERRLPLLTGGASDRPARHQTLRNAISWSYDLLDERERWLFRRLSIFVGGSTLDAVEVVCAGPVWGPADLLAGLESLMDKSLVLQEEPYGDPRFRMLETIREYAGEQLEAHGEAEEAACAHASFFLALVERAEEQIWGTQQRDWMTRLEQDYDNIRAALKWAAAEASSCDGATQPVQVGLRLSGALRHFWQVHGPIREGREWLLRMLSLPGAEGITAPRAKALFALGWLALFQGDYDDAARYCEASLAVWRELGDRWGASMALNGLGRAVEYLGDLTQARRLYEQALRLREELGNRWGIAGSINNLGRAALRQDDYDSARSLFETSVDLFRASGDKGSTGAVLNNLGLVALFEGDFERADLLLHEALSLERDVDYRWGIPYCLVALAELAWAQQQPQRAAILVGAADALFDVNGTRMDPFDRAHYERLLATLRMELSPTEFADAWARGKSLNLSEGIGLGLDVAVSPPAPSAPQTRPAATGPDEAVLTSRELDVLRLVAQGLTNKEIAERLDISPRTVQTHLYTIFGKLDVTTRSAAARYAFERNLL